MKIAITRRPIEVSTQAPAAILEGMLARIASIRGRASRWGVTDDATRAEFLAGYGSEADFGQGYYRSGFVEGAAPGILPGWAFSRTGAGAALTTAGKIVYFATGVPRITDRGMLIEPAATNLIRQSQNLSVSPWGSTNVTATANAALAPDDTTTATKLQATAAGGTFTAQTVTAASSTLTLSTYARKGSGATDANRFRLQNSTTAAVLLDITVNYDTGVITYITGSTGARADANIYGFWRISLSVSAGITAGNSIVAYVGFNGSAEGAGEHAFFWGTQVESGMVPTSYIPTAASTVTRGADTASTTLASRETGTLWAEIERGVARPASDTETVLGGPPDLPLSMNGANASSFVGGVTLALGAAPASFATSKMGYAWKPSRRAVAIAAGAVVSDAIGTALTSPVYLGSFGGIGQLTGYVRKFLHLPDDLSNTDLQGLNQ